LNKCQLLTPEPGNIGVILTHCREVYLYTKKLSIHFLRENIISLQKTWRETCSSDALFIIIPTFISLVSRPGLKDEIPSLNCLTHGTIELINIDRRFIVEIILILMYNLMTNA
jgi:hypothetical protein